MEKDDSFTVHRYNIQTLCIELYKAFSGQPRKRYFVICLNEKILIIICAHSLILLFRKLKAVYKGSNSVRYFGPIIYSLKPKEIKNCDTLASFISKIRQWRPDACLC